MIFIHRAKVLRNETSIIITTQYFLGFCENCVTLKSEN